MQITRRQAILDIGCIVGLAAVYVAAEAAAVPKRWIFAGIAAILAAFAWFVWRPRGETPRDLGLRGGDVLRCAGPVLGGTFVVAIGIVVWALASGRSPWRSDLAILLPLYPVYGVAQQLIFQGVLHRRLRILVADRRATVAITAIVFASVHLGDWRLVALTFAAGLAWSAAWLRWSNVGVLGLSHGILAAMTYPLIMGVRPLTRI